MKNSLVSTLNSYSHFTDKTIFSRLLTKVDDALFQDIGSAEDLRRLFFQLNKHIDMDDVTDKLIELEAYAGVMEKALRGMEDSTESAYALSLLNRQAQKTIRELFVMLDSRNLT